MCTSTGGAFAAVFGELRRGLQGESGDVENGTAPPHKYENK
jgi:hypothetical protein